MSARYFSHSPRGFANEVTIFAVEAEQADEWASWFNASNPPDAQPLVPVTRKQAERLLRRDGVLLLIHEADASYLHGDGRANRLNPDSVWSACQAAIDYRKACEEDDAFARERGHPPLTDTTHPPPRRGQSTGGRRHRGGTLQ
jgi:hypothetical protein